MKFLLMVRLYLTVILPIVLASLGDVYREMRHPNANVRAHLRSCRVRRMAASMRIRGADQIQRLIQLGA